MVWKPGQSGNPEGRPKVVRELAALAREHGPRAIERLAEILESSDAKAATSAAKELLDRGYGKAPQTVEHTRKDPRQMSDDEVKAEARRVIEEWQKQGQAQQPTAPADEPVH
jgi:hypothetical protein